MSSAIAAGSSVAGPEPIEPRRRGRLILAERVIEKVAGQAASEVSAASGRAGGILGLGAEADPQARPHVDVELSADSADLALSVGIAYPGSIRTATEEVRDHVVRRVRDLTGVSVRRVDIDVAFLAEDQDGSMRLLR